MARRTGDSSPPQTTVTTTRTKYTAFRRQASITISYETFIALSGYLYEILRLGYSIQAEQLDEFFLRYTSYITYVSTSFTRTNATTPVPSYHRWLAEQLSGLRERRNYSIVTATCLRRIANEHPFTFLRTRISIQCLVKAQKEAQDALEEDRLMDSFLNEV